MGLRTWTRKYPLTILPAGKKQKTNAFLAIQHVKVFRKKLRLAEKQKWYRANLRVMGEEKRRFGTENPDAWKSAENLLSRWSSEISISEKHRVLDLVKETYGTTGNGFQPRCPAASPVKIIHQMYGLFRDGKPMGARFLSSQFKWRKLASNIGAEYHLWSADEVDALIKQRYPQLWSTYVDCPFPVQRADIGRICILHFYGGLYADLDVEPNVPTFAETSFAVQKTYLSGYKRREQRGFKNVITKKKHSVYDKIHSIDMEVLIACKGNPVLMDWLRFIQQQLANANIMATGEVWSKWSIRYIHNTTGPKCLTRFLFHVVDKEVLRSLKYISSNNFSHCKELSTIKKRNFDVVSSESNSYFSHKKAFQSPAGCSNGQLSA